MANSYISCYVHLVFSTKERKPTISGETQARLWAYIGGIARQNGMKAIAVGGTADHVHVLLSLPSTISVAKAVQLVKGGSSKWMNDTHPGTQFSWQEGYGAFSIDHASLEGVRSYIHAQAEHHRQRPSRDEYLAFLQENGIQFDERYVWG